MRETWVQSLDLEDPLEKEMATYSCNLAWEIPHTEKLGKVHGVTKQSDTTQQLNKSKEKSQSYSVYV